MRDTNASKARKCKPPRLSAAAAVGRHQLPGQGTPGCEDSATDVDEAPHPRLPPTTISSPPSAAAMENHGVSEFTPLRFAAPQRSPRLRRAARQLSVYSTPNGPFSDCTPSGKWSELHEHLAAVLPSPRPQDGTAAAVADALAKAARLAFEKAEEDKKEEAEVEQLLPLRRLSVDEVERLCGVEQPAEADTSTALPRTPVKLRPRPRPRASPYLLSRVTPVSPERRK